MFVSVMAFHAQISDPLVGGTYMTLLNTVSNLGGNWPVFFFPFPCTYWERAITSQVTLGLSLVEELTWKECRVPGEILATPCANATLCQGYHSFD